MDDALILSPADPSGLMCFGIALSYLFMSSPARCSIGLNRRRYAPVPSTARRSPCGIGCFRLVVVFAR